MTKPPCTKECKSRYSRCHTTCELWLDYEQIHREEKEQIEKAKSQNAYCYGKAEWSEGKRRNWRRNRVK